MLKLGTLFIKTNLTPETAFKKMDPAGNNYILLDSLRDYVN